MYVYIHVCACLWICIYTQTYEYILYILIYGGWRTTLAPYLITRQMIGCRVLSQSLPISVDISPTIYSFGEKNMALIWYFYCLKSNMYDEYIGSMEKLTFTTKWNTTYMAGQGKVDRKRQTFYCFIAVPLTSN